MNVEGYNATIFRRNTTQITIDGDKDLPNDKNCCELKNPVLIADVSYKNVGDLQAGDSFMALQGAEKVIFADEPLPEDCVEVELTNGKKNKFNRLIISC